MSSASGRFVSSDIQLPVPEERKKNDTTTTTTTTTTTSISTALPSASKRTGNCVARHQEIKKEKHRFDFTSILFYIAWSRFVMSSGDESEQSRRHCVLSWDQVQRLDSILGESVPIHGRRNFPTLSVQPRQIVQVRVPL